MSDNNQAESAAFQKEIDIRVRFKMTELKTGLINTAQNYFGAALNSGNPKYQHYREALNQFAGMVQKEIDMPVPYPNMYDEKMRVIRDKAVKKLSETLIQRGMSGRDILHKEGVIANVVEEIIKQAVFI